MHAPHVNPFSQTSITVDSVVSFSAIFFAYEFEVDQNRTSKSSGKHVMSYNSTSHFFKILNIKLSKIRLTTFRVPLLDEKKSIGSKDGTLEISSLSPLRRSEVNEADEGQSKWLDATFNCDEARAC